MFFILITLLVLISGVWMTRPLWSSGLSEAQQRRAANVTAYRRRISEIDADLDAGLLDAETAGSLKKEQDVRLVSEAGQADSSRTESKRSLAMSVILPLLLLIAAGWGYASLGSWKTQEQIATGVPGTAGEHDAGSLEDMAKRLEARLEAKPEDVDGWILLARSRVMLEDFTRAARAFGQANQLSGQRNADWLVDEAEALAMSRERDMLGRPRQLFEAALKISPGHQKGLWYAGLAAIQADEHALAIRYWSTLSEQELPPVVRESLEQQLIELRGAHAGSDQGASEPVERSQKIEEPAIDGPSSGASGGLAIRVNVSIDPSVQDSINPASVLFIFAKAASGPPMPLAVYRGLASELPTSVTLDDSMAMMPALKISQFDAWTISARVSKDGQPQVGSGDVQGSLTIGRADLGDSALVLTLDEVVP